MNGFGIIGLLICLGCAVVTYQGLKYDSYLQRYKFQVGAILNLRQYGRLLSAGFLHVGWLHFGFNMLVLYNFAFGLEGFLGAGRFAGLYLLSLVGGNLLALYLHRRQLSYSAVGASGAVAGVVFACIALLPGAELTVFGLLTLPSWAYGLLYVLISIYGIRAKDTGVGHAAHLGGAITGLVVAAAIEPWVVQANYVTILLALLPTAAFLALVMWRPEVLAGARIFSQERGLYTLDDRSNIAKRQRQEEMNQLLDKISARGVDSLSKRERERLARLSEWWQDVEA
ncbi:rhomboid family intramembrane serine protease [Hymenobacter gummosus]|uniref:Rhomboid family intramembrane serine protease n=1 Tax=Hymenobacter gummosus TaxID=1776032 RepID=A0A431U660_9BACT|nr:rhomboid family intramembrane serine protease [Hymenobacter gummosus]RTQ51689.1 rhomboid family intramembrane serine protease [Hymenobacter gummosus]